VSDADNQLGGSGGQYGKNPAEEDDAPPDPKSGNVEPERPSDPKVDAPG
jgi:hypothetical protein